jgi:hypothetical protein
MQGLGVAGTKAFGDIALAQKSAAASAQAFEAALDAEDRAFDELRASLDPAFAATRRYEAAVDAATRAVKVGAATQDQANAVIAQARTRLDTFGGVVADGGRGMNAYRGQIQNTAFQIGDFAVQVAGGTKASTALAQQLPQLLGGFGAIGAVIGAGAAIGIPLLSFYFRENAAEAATLEEQIDGLSQALSDLRSSSEAARSGDLLNTYGPQTEQARALLDIQKEIANVEAQRALAAARDASIGAFGDFGGLTRGGFEAQAQMLADLDARYDALAAAKAAALAADTGQNFLGLETEMQSLENERRILQDTQAEIARISDEFGIARDSAVDLISAILAVNQAQGPAAAAVAAEELAAQLGIATDNFRDATDEGRSLGQSLLDVVLQGMQFAALDLASPIAAAASSAAVLARNMSISVTAASALLAAGGPSGNEPVTFDPRDPRFDAGAVALYNERQNYARVSPFVPSRVAQPSVPSGRGGAGGSSGTSPADQVVQDAEKMADAVDAILEDVARRYEQAGKRGADAISGMLTSIIDGSTSAKEALSALLQQLAEVQIQKAVLGLAGSGGVTGDIFAALGEALSVGTNANGTAYWRGGPTWVGERGPEILNLPRGSQVIDAQRSRQMADGGGSGALDVRVFVDQDGNWQAAVERISGRVAANTVGAYDREFNARARAAAGDRRLIR